MYPSKHKLVGKGKLRSELTIMPEAIKAIGYETGAFISNGYVSQPWGFVQGWDMYQNNLREGRGGIDGKRMAETAMKWMLPRKGKKTFMYIGTIDPHVTYRKHDHLIAKYDDPSPYKGRFRRACLGTDLGLIAGKKLAVTERDKTRIQALYKNEITYNDEAFGWLREQLEAAGMWEKTMVVITADHGDQFWERGGVGHGSGVHQDQVHVPFILYYPPLIPEKTRVTAGVDVIDLYPTLVDAIGGERPDSLQGKSVLPLVYKTTGDYPEPAIATSYLTHYGVQMREWKLYLKKSGYRLFDRKNDVLEKTDVAADHPLESRWLIDSTAWFRANRDTWDKTQHGAASNLNPGFFERIESD
jgi:arylsulfatase A-like enzyme